MAKKVTSPQKQAEVAESADRGSIKVCIDEATGETGDEASARTLLRPTTLAANSNYENG